MSWSKVQLLHCDGGVKCPTYSEPWDPDGSNSIAEQRAMAKTRNGGGWIQVGKEDFCRHCAVRLGYRKEKS